MSSFNPLRKAIEPNNLMVKSKNSSGEPKYHNPFQYDLNDPHPNHIIDLAVQETSPHKKNSNDSSIQIDDLQRGGSRR